MYFSLPSIHVHVCISVCLCMNIHAQGGGGGGGALIFSYIPRLGSFSGVHNFEFQYSFEFSEKLIFFGV